MYSVHNACILCRSGICCELSGNALLRDMCLEKAYKLTPSGKKKTYIIVEKAGKKGAAEKRIESEGLESFSQTINEVKPPVIQTDTGTYIE